LKIDNIIVVSEALKSRVNRQYITFVEDCMTELDSLKDL